ncbi:hypothetical protein [Blautia producta]|uniref:hypothetical protein n=1 Tax=Blautia producta TaxID=33035 RepID=UPI0031B59B00
MRIRKRLALLLLTLGLAAMQAEPVLAQGNTTVRVDAVNTGSRITASCVMEGSGTVTNGKIRLKYDPDELVLQSTAAGDMLSDMLVQVNDPLTGNKEPGEIVFVFAGAEPIEGNGNILDMEFQPGEKFQPETGAEIQVSVEEFASDGTEGDVTAENGTVPGKSPETPPDAEEPPTPETPTSPDDGNKEEQVGNQNTEKNEGTSGTKTEKTPVTKSADKKQITKTKTQTVKTGDENQIMPFAIAAVCALGVIIIYAIFKKKKSF